MREKQTVADCRMTRAVPYFLVEDELLVRDCNGYMLAFGQG